MLRSFLNRPFTLIIHIALVIIVAGAIVTHFFGIQGSVTLTEGELPVCCFDKSSGPGSGTFPFQISLKEVKVSNYPGTSAPMDFMSILEINGELTEVSMNNIGVFSNWRFYQSAISGNSSTLNVSYDPVGIAITYSGYILLGIGMIGYFFQPSTPWRSLINRYGKFSYIIAMLFCSVSSEASSSLPAMQKPLAANLGKAYVYWNDRVCPLQTMARDVTSSLYGRDHYEEYTAEQVLSGWLFYFDEWWRDYCGENPEIMTVDWNNLTARHKKLASKLSLIQWLGSGEAFRIYPYHASGGNLEWLSLTGKRPSAMSLEQWMFMQSAMPEIKRHLLKGENIEANEVISRLIAGQKRYADVRFLPSEYKMKIELIYNEWGRPVPASILCFILASLFWGMSFIKGRYQACLRRICIFLTVLAIIYVVGLMAAIWYLSGHLPISNGPETMLFMALIALVGSLIVKGDEFRGALLLIAGATMAVAAMGSATPRIASLLPVLASPLLSVHVMLVMTSYVLFMLMSILSASALLSHSMERKINLRDINLILLTPAVFLLAAGIFIGAVWANQSWGRYWGWDPKETCALIMFLIYSVPLHWASRRMRCFRKPKVLHIYLLCAVFSVLFTYFGANYLLPGLHSYA